MRLTADASLRQKGRRDGVFWKTGSFSSFALNGKKNTLCRPLHAINVTKAKHPAINAKPRLLSVWISSSPLHWPQVFCRGNFKSNPWNIRTVTAHVSQNVWENSQLFVYPVSVFVCVCVCALHSADEKKAALIGLLYKSALVGNRAR